MRTQPASFSLPANTTMRPRSGHSVIPYGDNHLLVFGGVTYNRAEATTAVATNDLLLLDWSTARGGDTELMWRPLTNRTAGGGSEPEPRQRAATALSGELLWVFGGLDNSL